MAELPNVYFSLAHKGGTGRSVASINLAYQMSKMGYRVALLDLDIGAATLHHICRPLGAASIKLSLEDAGAVDRRLEERETITKYLRGSSVTAKDIHYVDLYEKGQSLAAYSKKSNRGMIRLYPGTDPGDISDEPDALAPRLKEILDFLTHVQKFQVICDVRSGDTGLLHALLNTTADNRRFRAHWTVFLRATPQHMAGAQTLLRVVVDKRQEAPESILRLVPTAVLPYDDADWLARRSTEAKLQEWAAQMYKVIHHEIDTLRERYQIRRRNVQLSFEDALQWSEGIVVENSGLATRYYGDIKELVGELLKP